MPRSIAYNPFSAPASSANGQQPHACGGFENPLKCLFCGETFLSLRSFELHILSTRHAVPGPGGIATTSLRTAASSDNVVESSGLSLIEVDSGFDDNVVVYIRTNTSVNMSRGDREVMGSRRDEGMEGDDEEEEEEEEGEGKERGEGESGNDNNPLREASILKSMEAVPGPQDGTFIKRLLEIERERQEFLAGFGRPKLPAEYLNVKIESGDRPTYSPTSPQKSRFQKSKETIRPFAQTDPASGLSNLIGVGHLCIGQELRLEPLCKSSAFKYHHHRISTRPLRTTFQGDKPAYSPTWPPKSSLQRSKETIKPFAQTDPGPKLRLVPLCKSSIFKYYHHRISTKPLRMTFRGDKLAYSPTWPPKTSLQKSKGKVLRYYQHRISMNPLRTDLKIWF